MKKGILLSFALLLVMISLNTVRVQAEVSDSVEASVAAATVSTKDLAAYWAPDFYQDVNDTYGYASDYMTNFDYDGDWKGNNNWENMNNFPLRAYAYYSVVETTTHWFIGYYDYHARDDGPIWLDAHENDMEGLLLVIRKDGSTYGSFQLMETLSHNQYYQYTNDGTITTGSDNIDGKVLLTGSIPKSSFSPTDQVQ